MPIEEKNPRLNWKKIWKRWEGIKSPSSQSMIFLFLHDVWITGEVAFKRHIIHLIPPCHLCGQSIDSKKHLILHCPKTAPEREKIKRELLRKQGGVQDNHFLYTNEICDDEIYGDLISYITNIIKSKKRDLF
jgi:hypothetical protein